MKTYQELSQEQQTRAVEKCTQQLQESIVEGAIRFNDSLNHDNLQERIDATWAEVERLHTPWFAGEAIMETCRTEIEGMAQCAAEDSLYPEEGENVIVGIAHGKDD
jgi:hypothetical protein